MFLGIKYCLRLAVMGKYLDSGWGSWAPTSLTNTSHGSRAPNLTTDGGWGPFTGHRLCCYIPLIKWCPLKKTDMQYGKNSLRWTKYAVHVFLLNIGLNQWLSKFTLYCISVLWLHPYHNSFLTISLNTNPNPNPCLNPNFIPVSQLKLFHLNTLYIDITNRRRFINLINICKMVAIQSIPCYFSGLPRAYFWKVFTTLASVFFNPSQKSMDMFPIILIAIVQFKSPCWIKVGVVLVH